MEAGPPDDADGFADVARAGLAEQPKRLPCRFLYDAEGSRLFEEICTLPEYYLTRAEREILERHAAEIAARLPVEVDLVELGSGSAEKTEVLLRAFEQRGSRVRYVPIDICREVLEQSGERLLERHEDLSILAVEAEYADGLERLERDGAARARLVLWLGSNVGNFDRPAAAAFLARVRGGLREEDRLLLGVDLRKERAVLEAAYDDARGVTARFNLNLLVRANRELGADFDVDAFRHEAVYDEDLGRVDMYLLSRRDQEVSLGPDGPLVHFAVGERVHTESSYKYSVGEIDSLARAAGLAPVERWLDSARRYSLNLLRPA